MRAIFKHSRKIGGVVYHKKADAQEVPEKMKDDWFFKACLKDGSLKLVDEKAAEKSEAAEQAPEAEAPVAKKKGK